MQEGRRSGKSGCCVAMLSIRAGTWWASECSRPRNELRSWKAKPPVQNGFISANERQFQEQRVEDCVALPFIAPSLPLPCLSPSVDWSTSSAPSRSGVLRQVYVFTNRGCHIEGVGSHLTSGIGISLLTNSVVRTAGGLLLFPELEERVTAVRKIWVRCESA